jgi:hypothetical protein
MHDFGKYNKEVQEYFSRLSGNSLMYLEYQIKKGDIAIRDDRPKSALFSGAGRLLRMTEQYMFYLYTKFKKEPQKFEYILKTIEAKVPVIAMLEDRNCDPGHTYYFGERRVEKKLNNLPLALINPNLYASRTLSAESRTRLYVAHELGHVINEAWMQDANKYANYLYSKGALTKQEAEMFVYGFSMLDEAITQERGEEFAYSYTRSLRPRLVSTTDSKGMYPDHTFETNFDWYGELQTPAILFARTLRGIGKIRVDRNALNELANRALSPTFAKDVIAEYQHKDHAKDLVQLLKVMGIIRRASYARFGMDSQAWLKESGDALESVQSMAEELRDKESVEF